MEILLLLLFATTAHAEIYKCGNTFSDTPCGADAVRVATYDARTTGTYVSVQRVQADEGPRVSTLSQGANVANCNKIKADRADAEYWAKEFQHPDNIAWKQREAKALNDQHFSKCYGTANGNQ